MDRLGDRGERGILGGDGVARPGWRAELVLLFDFEALVVGVVVLLVRLFVVVLVVLVVAREVLVAPSPRALERPAQGEKCQPH